MVREDPRSLMARTYDNMVASGLDANKFEELLYAFLAADAATQRRMVDMLNRYPAPEALTDTEQHMLLGQAGSPEEARALREVFGTTQTDRQ